jgi:RNA polymerase sigma factor (sigma-70 family)
MPFYLWLRRLAWNQLIDLQRRHIASTKRSVLRVEFVGLNDQSTWELAKRLTSGRAGPSSAAIRRELVQRLQVAMKQLPESEREVLILKYVEQLTSQEAAAVLAVSQRTVQIRHRRALLKLNRWLSTDST